MAHTFKLFNTTSTGATIDFMDTSHGVVEYNPTHDWGGAPEVTETAVIRLKSTTSTGLTTLVENLTRALQESQNKFERNYSTLNYLYLGYDGVDTGRSPLRRGSIVSLSDPRGGGWVDHEITATVQLTRSNYWESTGLVALTITNLNSTGTTTAGTIIYNAADMVGSVPTEGINWAKVTPAGDLPSPAEIYMKPSSTAATATIAGVFATSFFQHAGESSTAWTGYGWMEGSTGAGSTATSTGATYAGNSLGTKVISAGTTGENYEWTFENDLEAAYNRVLMGAKFNGTVVIKPYFLNANVYSYGETTVCTSTGGKVMIFDLGQIKAAAKIGDVTIGTVKFGMNIQWTAGGTFYLDWVQVVPSNSQMTVTGLTVNVGDPAGAQHLYIKPVGDRVFAYNVLTGVGTLFGRAAAQGGILLQPNLVNWVFFKWLSSATGENARASVRLKLYYRPRWRYIHDS